MSIDIAAQPTVLVLTALQVEMQAVLAPLSGRASQQVGPVLCEIRSFQASNGLVWQVIAAELGPGTVDTVGAVVATTAEFSPDVLIFVGIAGALKSDVAIGDVVAGSEVVWTERGKWDESGYIPRIRTVSLSSPLSQRARQVARTGTWTKRLISSEEFAPKAIVGQIASGEKVIADDEYRLWLQRTFSDALAIENEGYALARAAELYTDCQRYVVRGISDSADGTKSDNGQPIAAEAAAAFTFELLDAYSSAQASAAASPVPAISQDAEPSTHTSNDGPANNLVVLADDLIRDIDFLEDDRSQIEELARDIVGENEDSTLADLLLRIGAVLSTNVNSLIARRLQWFGRQMLRSAGPRLTSWQLEESAKSAPSGVALLLTERSRSKPHKG